MVKLYGVEHSMTVNYGFLIPQSKKLPVMPSDEFFADLESLPRGSRIGLECFNEKDWQDVKDHLKINAVRAGFLGHPYYDDVANSYWRSIIDFCEKSGHKTVFLEDKKTWKGYNKASIRLVKCQGVNYTSRKEKVITITMASFADIMKESTKLTLLGEKSMKLTGTQNYWKR